MAEQIERVALKLAKRVLFVTETSDRELSIGLYDGVTVEDRRVDDNGNVIRNKLSVDEDSDKEVVLNKTNSEYKPNHRRSEQIGAVNQRLAIVVKGGRVNGGYTKTVMGARRKQDEKTVSKLTLEQNISAAGRILWSLRNIVASREITKKELDQFICS